MWQRSTETGDHVYVFTNWIRDKCLSQVLDGKLSVNCLLNDAFNPCWDMVDSTVERHAL